MPFVEEIPKLAPRALLERGIPALLAATVLSVLTHQYTHIIANNVFCSGDSAGSLSEIRLLDNHIQANCGISSAAGPLWTFFLALLSFALFLRHQESLFFSSMAFVNACYRLPHAVGMIYRLSLSNRTAIPADESLSLALVNIKDPSGLIAILFFYSLISTFLAITIIHDLKILPAKWLIAVVTAVGLSYLENWFLVLLPQIYF